VTAHGHDGPLHTEPHDLAPISQKLLESFESQGFPLHHDMFTTGEVPHGCGHVVRTHHHGLRTTGADFVTKDYHHDNTEILTDTTVDKIVLRDDNGSLRATGVDLIDKSGRKRTVTASREIIVSGGAYCSPPILLRSGIGPKDELEKLGVHCVVDLPGVGKNLLDHLVSVL
jgi:choline dehydrogenase-like flavoprotein